MKKLLFSYFILSLFFFKAMAQIPNGDMESWNRTNFYVPSQWETHGIVTRVSPAVDGNYAVKLQSDPTHNDIGAIVYGRTDSNSISGGVPFTERPDSFEGYFQFDIKTGDTAWIVVALQKDGSYVSYDIIHLTGSSKSGWTRLAFEINYLSGQTPDTVFVGVTSSNPQGKQYYDSYIEVDDFHFISSTQQVPNNSFETWDSVGYDVPAGWFSPNNVMIQPVTKTTDARSGLYAMKLQNIMGGFRPVPGICATVKDGTPDTLAFRPMPAFPVTKKPDTLYLYAKFLPKNNDSATIMVQMFNKGKQVGNGIFSIGGSGYSKYTLVKVPVFYMGGPAPDSAYIAIGAFAFHNGPPNPRGESELYVDNMSFELQNTGIRACHENSAAITVFPNPVKNVLQISQDKDCTIIGLELTDITGKLMARYSYGTHSLDLQDLSPGMYVLRITTNKGITEKKIWKEQ